MHSLPSFRQLLTFTVLLPAAVAGTAQLLSSLVISHRWLRPSLYPWMIFTTAVLSWCAGRYLAPAWLRWIVFAWSLLLLNLITFAACSVGGPLPHHFAYMLISAEISLLSLWAILSRTTWQLRLPGVMVAVPVLILLTANFHSYWRHDLAWHTILLLTTIIGILLCSGLRFSGFLIQEIHTGPTQAIDSDSLKVNQFGLKHLFVWATCLVPLILVVRELDFGLLASLEAKVAFPAALAALTTAIVTLTTIFAVLGIGLSVVRLAALLLLSLLTVSGSIVYFQYLETVYSNRRSGWMLRELGEMLGDWSVALLLNAPLLAALLLFLRASGYRLVHKKA